MGVRSKTKFEVPMYEGNLNDVELIDWINVMDKHFEYENMFDDKNVLEHQALMVHHTSLECSRSRD
jgi:hypothetical protein